MRMFLPGLNMFSKKMNMFLKIPLIVSVRFRGRRLILDRGRVGVGLAGLGFLSLFSSFHARHDKMSRGSGAAKPSTYGSNETSDLEYGLVGHGHLERVVAGKER